MFRLVYPICTLKVMTKTIGMKDISLSTIHGCTFTDLIGHMKDALCLKH